MFWAKNLEVCCHLNLPSRMLKAENLSPLNIVLPKLINMVKRLIQQLRRPTVQCATVPVKVSRIDEKQKLGAHFEVLTATQGNQGFIVWVVLRHHFVRSRWNHPSIIYHPRAFSRRKHRWIRLLSTASNCLNRVTFSLNVSFNVTSGLISTKCLGPEGQTLTGFNWYSYKLIQLIQSRVCNIVLCIVLRVQKILTCVNISKMFRAFGIIFSIKMHCKLWAANEIAEAMLKFICKYCIILHDDNCSIFRIIYERT